MSPVRPLAAEHGQPPKKQTAAHRRAWTGPAIFSAGFRPFFLGAAIWAMLAMALWIPMVAGRLELPTRLAPVDWHVHASAGCFACRNNSPATSS